MEVVLVHIHVKPECLSAFQAATLLNAQGSLAESGVVRFDVHQQADNPCLFVLHEVYKDEEAVRAHKETAHYLTWREAVADMMAEPRKGQRYVSVYPSDARF